MKIPQFLPRLLAAALALTLTACATPAKFDYSAFKESRPRSILVLPPLNSSPDINASYSVLSHTTYPLAEAGYYVLPVTLVNETFHQNGLDATGEIHQVPLPKLYEIFGADAVLYINVKNYGTSYVIISSETRVTAEARLVDAKSGKTLWTGSATASSAEGNNNNSGGLVGLLVKAIVSQIVDNLGNRGHQIAGIATTRLLSAGMPNGILYGPRSPLYMKDGSPQP